MRPFHVIILRFGVISPAGKEKLAINRYSGGEIKLNFGRRGPKTTLLLVQSAGQGGYVAHLVLNLYQQTPIRILLRS